MPEVVTRKSLREYKNEDESFIYGINGLLRLTFGKEVLYNYIPMESLDFFFDIACNQAIDGVFAVTDKRIIFIGSNAVCNFCDNLVYSFDIKDMDIKYRNVLGKKEFVITTNGKKIFNFTEPEIIFECYGKQKENIEKIRLILSEYVFK